MKYNHVIILEDSSKVSFGGGQNISLQVSHMLNNSGLELSFVDFTNHSRYIDRVEKEFAACPRVILNNDFPIKLPSIGRKIWELLTLNSYAKKNAKKITKILTSQTIIYATTRRALLCAYYINRQLNIPYVYHAHLVEDGGSWKYELIKKALLNAKSIVCVSRTVFDSIADGNKIQLYNPAPINIPEKKINRNERKVVATIGSLIPIKGIEYFIEAAKLLENNPDIEFRVYGEGPLKEKLMAYSRTNVRFMGFCEDIMVELAGKIDIFVQPTIIQEALPTTIIEAKTLGIPVVTTNIGGQAEIVKNNENGILVPVKNSKEISVAIEKLCCDKEFYNLMCANSRQSSMLFDRREFGNKITEIITQ